MADNPARLRRLALPLLIVAAALTAGCDQPVLSLNWNRPIKTQPPASASVAGRQPTPADVKAGQDDLANRVQDYVRNVEEQLKRQDTDPPGSTRPAFSGPRIPGRFTGGLSPTRKLPEIKPAPEQKLPAPAVTTTIGGPGTVIEPIDASPANVVPPVTPLPKADEPEAKGRPKPPPGDPVSATPAIPPEVTTVSQEGVIVQPTPEPPQDTHTNARVAEPDWPMVHAISPQPADEKADAAIREARELAEARPADFPTQLRLRMLYIAAGRYGDARSPWIGGTRREQELLTSWVEAAVALSAARIETADDSTLKALDAVEHLHDRLAEHAPLRIEAVRLVSRVSGFGVVTPFTEDLFLPGQWVIVYCEIRNFTSRMTDQKIHETQLSLRVELLSTEGKTFLEEEDDDVIDHSLNRRRDFFLARRLRIPANLSTGHYVIRVSVTDRVAQKVGESMVRLRVK